MNPELKTVCFSNIVFDEGINVSDVDVQVNRAQDATIQICIDVEDWLQFHRVLARIEDLPGLIHVQRRSSMEPRQSPPKRSGKPSRRAPRWTPAR